METLPLSLEAFVTVFCVPSGSREEKSVEFASAVAFVAVSPPAKAASATTSLSRITGGRSSQEQAQERSKGQRESKSNFHFDNIFVYQDLDQPSAKRIQDIEQMCGS